MNRPSVLRLNPSDSLVVATRDIAAGEDIGYGVKASEAIPRGHKVAIKGTAAGQPVRKLGQIIGVAISDIKPGQRIHVHNLEFRASAADHSIGTHRSNHPVLPEDKAATFMGIRREDGTVATRNYIGVLTTVNCSATVARLISDHFRLSGEMKDYPNVDGVVALTHKDGCSAGDQNATMLSIVSSAAGISTSITDPLCHGALGSTHTPGRRSYQAPSS